MESSGQQRFELGVPGPLRDRLVASVLAGDKVATSSLLVEYETGGEALPRSGDRSVLVNSSNAAVALVEVTAAEVIRLGDADLQLASDEGEGYGSVREWRDAHEAFWRSEVLPGLPGSERLQIDDDTRIVVERFRVVTRI